MKKLLTLLAASLSLTGLSWAAPLKIGIVDMGRIYMEYHKTQSNEAELEKDKAEAKSEVEKRLKKFEVLKQDFETQQKTINGAGSNAALRQKAEKEAQQKTAEMQSLRRDIEEFARRRQAQIADKLTRMRKDILADLHKFVAEKSKAENYDLVFDKAGRSPTGVEFLLFSKDAIDFTDDLLKDVNKDAPAGAPKKAAGDAAKPAPAKDKNP